MIGRDRKGERTLSPTERRRMLALFRPYRGRLGAVLALIGLSAGLGMISPFLLRGVLDEAIPNQDTTLLAELVVGMIAIAIATGALVAVLDGLEARGRLSAPPAALTGLLHPHPHR